MAEDGGHLQVSYQTETRQLAQLLLSHYTTKTTQFQRQRENLSKLRTWVADHVDQDYYKSCCKPQETLPQWYRKLQDAAQPD